MMVALTNLSLSTNLQMTERGISGFRFLFSKGVVWTVLAGLVVDGSYLSS